MLGPPRRSESRRISFPCSIKWKLFRRKSVTKVAVEFPAIPVTKETAGPLKRRRAPRPNPTSFAWRRRFCSTSTPFLRHRQRKVRDRPLSGPDRALSGASDGEASFNILKMVREGLRIELRGAVHRAFTKREKVVRSDIHVEANGKARTIRLTVQPFQQKAMEGLAMVIFEEVVPSGSDGSGKRRAPRRSISGRSIWSRS